MRDRKPKIDRNRRSNVGNGKRQAISVDVVKGNKDVLHNEIQIHVEVTSHV